MPLGKLNEDFRDLLVEFSDEDVEFLLVGAFAVAFHGVPRATGDIDVLSDRRVRLRSGSLQRSRGSALP